MRLGDRKPDSSSFLIYLTNMNARGALLSNIRTYGQLSVTQAVAQVMSAKTKLSLAVAGSLRECVLGKVPSLDTCGVQEFHGRAAAKLCSTFPECVLQLRHGRVGLAPAT